MNIIIQKFGGTSVATCESRQKVVEKVKKAVDEGKNPVVVVSAMGRKGAPYATDTLIHFAEDNAGELTSREYDLLVSCGEIISTVIIATLLQKNGLKAKAMTGGQAGIITDSCHKKADLICSKPEQLLAVLEKGEIPVVAGFQGMSIEGEVTTLGRGGSDTTAAMLGMALKAECIEIYTDVDGIMTADPRDCNRASIIPVLSYNEVFQMADSGAKVIHPRAVEYARRAGVPLKIKNTFSDEKGTYIVHNAQQYEQAESHHKVVTSIASRKGRVQYRVEEDILVENDLLTRIADNHISIDLINVFPNYKVFTIDQEDAADLEAMLEKEAYHYTTIKNCAKVTLIGERMTGVPGVMARILRTLSKAGIEILQTADSLSTIACLIKEEEVISATNVLHDAFLV